MGAVLVFRDISEHKRLAELTHQAFHDSLTGLPNRRQFLADLTNALERSRHDGACHAVLFADIDRFKVINDSLGHSAGDLFLISVAEKLKKALRPGDKLARLGGDEFTVLLEDIGSPEDAAVVAQRVLRIMREPIELADGHKTAARLSIGIALTSPGQDLRRRAPRRRRGHVRGESQGAQRRLLPVRAGHGRAFGRTRGTGNGTSPGHRPQRAQSVLPAIVLHL